MLLKTSNPLFLQEEDSVFMTPKSSPAYSTDGKDLLAVSISTPLRHVLLGERGE